MRPILLHGWMAAVFAVVLTCGVRAEEPGAVDARQQEGGYGGTVKPGGECDEEFSLLTAALEAGDREEAEQLFSRAPDLRERLNPADRGSAGEWTDVPLFVAAARGDVGLADCLIALGADVNIVYLFKTPLHIAIDADDTEMVRFLLSRGADPGQGDCDFNLLSPLTYALLGEDRSPAVVEALRSAYRSEDMAFPLCAAARAGDRETVAYLLERGADPDSVWGEEGTGSSALGEAVEYGHTAILRLLVEHGADVNRPVSREYDETEGLVAVSPLDLARGNGEMIGILTAAGAQEKQ